MASLSIVILNYNGKHFLEKFLPSIITYSKGHEIVVADNNSSDDSLGFLSNTYPNIRLIELSKNFGFCTGYNKAIQQLDSEFIVLLNSDIEVTENWVDPVIKLFENDEQIAAIQPKLLDYNFKDKFEYAGGAGGLIDKYGYPFCRGRIFDTIETDAGQYDDSREVFWATGACLFIRSKLFKYYGGFDDDFFAHMEEIDLCWRMKNDGYKVFYCGDSKIYHVGGGTLSYANPHKIYLNFRNSLMMLLKNLPTKSLFWKIPIRWIVDYIAAAKFLLSGDIRDAWMVLKAHFYIWKNLKSIIGKRSKSIKPIKNPVGIYPKFLLFDYHLRRVRKFKDMKF